VRIPPLRGTALVVLDAKLVFALVDNFFGGDGRFQPRIEGRDFTLVETRVIGLTLERVFADMQDAWAPVLTLAFEYVNAEINPQFANIVSPTEVVVVSTFKLDLDGVGGELHVAYPYAMLEPIRELLDAGMQSDRASRDERWAQSIREETAYADVEVHATLAEVEMKLGDVLKLKAGDIVPVELPALVMLCAENVPLFRGRFGVVNGTNALEIVEPVKRAAWGAKPADKAAGVSPAPKAANGGVGSDKR